MDQSMSESGDLTQAQYYDRIRSQIEQGDQQINLRVIWQLIAQAFFFNAFTSLLSSDAEAKNQLFEGQQQLLLWLIPVTGLTAGIFASIGIYASLANIHHLRALYEGFSDSKRPDDHSAKRFPPIQGPDRFRKLGTVAPIGLPILLTLAWLIIVIRLLAG
jgi:hypothetical protein